MSTEDSKLPTKGGPDTQMSESDLNKLPIHPSVPSGPPAPSGSQVSAGATIQAPNPNVNESIDTGDQPVDTAFTEGQVQGPGNQPMALAFSEGKSLGARPKTHIVQNLPNEIKAKDQSFQRAIRRWRRLSNTIQAVLLDTNDEGGLKQQRSSIVEAMEHIYVSADNLARLLPDEDSVPDFDDIERSHTELIHAINNRLIDISRETRSCSKAKSIPGRAPSSQGTNRSTKSLRVEALAKAAEMKVRLKFFHKEAEAQRLKIEKDLEIAEAKLKVIKEEQDTVSIPSQFLQEQEEDAQQRVADFIKASPNPEDAEPSPPDTSLVVSSASDVIKSHVQVPASCTVTHAVPMSQPRPPVNQNVGYLQHVSGFGSFPMTSTTTVVSTSQPRMSTSATGNHSYELSSSADKGFPNRNPTLRKPVGASFLSQGVHVPPTESLSGYQVPSSGQALYTTPVPDAPSQMSFHRLPPPDPGVFSGNPLEYPSWKKAFDLLIDRCPISPAEKLYYLCRYVSGEAKECISGYLLETSDASYFDARARLTQRFGDQSVISNAYKKRLREWPRVKTGSDFLFLTDYLKQLQSAMKSNAHLNRLNDPGEYQLVLSKLPDKVVELWAREVQDYRKGHNMEYPGFSKFTDFMVVEAGIASDPVVSVQAIRGAFDDQKEEKSTDRDKGSKKPKSRSFNTLTLEDSSKGTETPANRFKSTESSSMQTKLTDPEQSTMYKDRARSAQRKPKRGICYFCKDSHFLSRCKEFRSVSITERLQFLTENGVCFRCLCKGHCSNECQKTMVTCCVCNGPHNSLTHTDKASQLESSRTVNPGRNPQADSFNPSSSESSQVHRVSSTA